MTLNEIAMLIHEESPFPVVSIRAERANHKRPGNISAVLGKVAGGKHHVCGFAVSETELKHAAFPAAIIRHHVKEAAQKIALHIAATG